MHLGALMLIYYEAYLERAYADVRERYLKSGGEGDSYFDNCGIISKFSTSSSDVPRKLSGFTRATPLGFEPRITPPKGAVLPLHHGVSPFRIVDFRSIRLRSGQVLGLKAERQLSRKAKIAICNFAKGSPSRRRVCR